MKHIVKEEGREDDFFIDSAAMGLSIRCAGHGNHVLIVQFLKSRPTGELASLALLPNIEVMRGKETKKFTFQMNDEEKAEVKREHMVLFDKVKQKCANEHIDLLIFDEIIGACNTGGNGKKFRISLIG